VIFLQFCHNSRVRQTDRQTDNSSPDRVCILQRGNRKNSLAVLLYSATGRLMHSSSIEERYRVCNSA